MKFRNYSNKIILEFGSGQSTLWWAEKAEQVISLEADLKWYEQMKKRIPDNVNLIYVGPSKGEENVQQVKKTLEELNYKSYDVMIIDGLHRVGMIRFAEKYLSNQGILICDNAESYGFYDALKESDFLRVDFFGVAPGVILPHSTSIYFRPSSFVFNAKYIIPNIAVEY